MTGRILSGEEIQEVSEHYEWDNFDDDAQATIHDLIATIRHLQNGVITYRKASEILNEQNIIFREALELVADEGFPSILARIKVAREALAKVRGDE